MSKMGKVPQPLDAPTKGSLPKQDHSAMEGKMLPPKKPTDMPWPRNTPKVGTQCYQLCKLTYRVTHLVGENLLLT